MNAANVMPIIFAQAIMFIPITLVGFSEAASASGIVRAFVDHTSFWYNFVFAVLFVHLWIILVSGIISYLLC